MRSGSRAMVRMTASSIANSPRRSSASASAPRSRPASTPRSSHRRRASATPASRRGAIRPPRTSAALSPRFPRAAMSCQPARTSSTGAAVPSANGAAAASSDGGGESAVASFDGGGGAVIMAEARSRRAARRVPSGTRERVTMSGVYEIGPPVRIRTTALRRRTGAPMPAHSYRSPAWSASRSVSGVDAPPAQSPVGSASVPSISGSGPSRVLASSGRSAAQ